MARLSEKYLAGFLDADGCIRVWHDPGHKYPQIYLVWVQKTDQSEVLDLINRDYGVNLYTYPVNGVDYSKAQIGGKNAAMLLQRIAKYLVVKRHYANIALDCLDRHVEDHQKFSEWLKEQRKIKSLPLPNYPSRKWLAGFFDGDGCLAVQELTANGRATLVAHIASSSYDTESIELIQKAFGGTIHDMRNGSCRQWKMTMQPSKVNEFLGHFGKYSIVKKSQIDFLLGCADMGHFRDGKSIKDGLKQLKAQKHRLNETRLDVKELVTKVQDLPKVWERTNIHTHCKRCGENSRPHYSNGMCSPCYQRTFKEDRAIVGNP